MARRPAGGGSKRAPKANRKKGADKTEPEQQKLQGMSAGTPMQVPTDKQIVDAFEVIGKLKTAARSKAGLVGAEVKDRVDNQSFDKKALSTGQGLWNLPDERFRIVWTHLKKYAQAMGFDKRADAQYAMFEEGGQDAMPNQGTETDGDKVHQLQPRQPRAVGETAGGPQH